MLTDAELETLDDRPVSPPITDEQKIELLQKLIAARDEHWRVIAPAEAAAYARHLAEAQARYLRDTTPKRPWWRW